ncbi:probable ATP-dependent RNA helicase DHX34 [Aphis gossypii]|uniref:probable ATP-dependent RNA helicase DHX34 n=1 Tax=Aphis gossypii TaxID=80765 RepID=UPI002158BDCB|nr:probable ATP-dependent RNA helicase DHX34 [Aphis gossypii]
MYREKRRNPDDGNSNPKHQKIKRPFTFLDYKRILEKVFFNEDLVEDINDVWLFVKKFESFTMKKPTSDNSVVANLSSNPLKLPEVFDKMHLINLKMNYSDDELASRLPTYDQEEAYEKRPLTKEDISKFRQLVLMYMDFKQKEKFNKLRKLRETQQNLPVYQFKDEIIEAVKNHRVVIIAGDTGCGKSTQIPQYLSNAGFKRIACTQPRRIACISLSKRVAYESLSIHNNDVGYQIRFEKTVNKDTKILFLTEGLLLRQVCGEDLLSQYDVIVLDEIHERHLHGDFLLGVMKCLLHQRSDVKLVLMSATINVDLFSKYFSPLAKLIQVPGRLYPIKLEYHPIISEMKVLGKKSERFDPSPFIKVMHMIDKKYPKHERGDVLMFLSGMAEITAVVDAARVYCEKNDSWIILPLHSSMSLGEQDKVFDYAPEGTRKCIVSTNIAETSITIDGIRFVVDSGKVKEMSYDSTSKVQRLKEFWVSKASADQRKGRAGRTGPGVCYRLYSEDEFDAMADYSTPELQKVPLDALLLQMVAMGLPNARLFPFIEPPQSENIENAIESLKQHGALTKEERLTPIGKMLSQLPVDIPLGKMLIMGSLFDQLEPVLSLACVLSVQTPFTNKAYKDTECERARMDLESDHGDPIILLNAFKQWLELKSDGQNTNTRQWCKRRGFEEQRFYEMTKLRRQFKDLLDECGLVKNEEKNMDDMTSAERALRHGELKLLRGMKKTHKEEDSRKRKVLKKDMWEIEDNLDAEDDSVDIRDIDFRLRHNQRQVKQLLKGSTAISYKDLMMLKIILSSGLYPHIAISDEFNSLKTTKEHLFHTEGKPFVSLHPMSYFGNHSDVLQLTESEIIYVPEFKGKNTVSSKHQILIYMSLLETTKAYIMNSLRMPGAQTLLLFSRNICTNRNFSQIICDSWLLMEFPLPEAAENLILKATKLRNTWDNLLKLKLEEKSNRKAERQLSADMVQFMNAEIGYTMKRLLAADQKVMYIGPSGEDVSFTGPNPFCGDDWQVCEDDKYGGIRLAPYLTYDCLTGQSLVVYDPWICPICNSTIEVTSALEKLQHRQVCDSQTTSGTAEAEEREDDMAKLKPNAKRYDCPHCPRVLYLTPTEMLKHKKSHL